MTPLDAAMLRFGRAALAVVKPGLAERALSTDLDEEEEARAAEDVDRLADMLASR